MKKIFFLSMLVKAICFSTAYCQQHSLNSAELLNANSDNIEAFIKVRDVLEGFYQIQIINSRANPEISFDLLMKIQENQQEDEVVFFKYREKIRVKVLPVNALELIQPKDKIVYLDN
jgi:hypothetical protein